MASPEFYRINGLEQQDVISFAGGWVNHEAPTELQQIYQEIVSHPERFHRCGAYAPTLGLPECKTAIVAFERHLYGMEEIQEEQIAIGASSTQMTFDLMSVLMDPGDKILLLDPTYCNFPIQIKTAMNVSIIRFTVVDETFSYQAEERAEAINAFIIKEKPKVVLLVSPDNPTSQILPQKFVEKALEGMQEIGGFLVIDFAYKEIVFPSSLPSYFSWAPNPNFLSLHSNSKWCRGLGRRLAWIEADQEVIEGFEPIQSSSLLCADTLHQMALTAYVQTAVQNGSLKKYLQNMQERYARAAKKMTDEISTQLGLPHFKPEGGLYTCMHIGRESASFVEEILKSSGVLLVPGWGFGRSLHEAVRISFGPLVNDLDKIHEGMARLRTMLSS